MLQNPLKHIRWSLRTQVLAMLFVGLLFLIWQRREPWSYDRDITCEELLKMPYSYVFSPDQHRETWRDDYTGTIGVLDRAASSVGQSHTKLWSTTFKVDDRLQLENDPCFLDDDTIAVSKLKRTDDFERCRLLASFAVYHRRFPEWWWGQLYRPEVWLFPLFLGAVIWTIRKDRAVTK